MLIIINIAELKTINYIFYKIFLFSLIIVSLLFSCGNSITSTKIYAAAGTMLPINEIINNFPYNKTSEIEKNFAASGSLARQIKSGAEADIYISANKQWIDYLANNNLLIVESIKELARNKLVIVCLKEKELNIKFDNDFNINSIINDKISIGDPQFVPAGTYAKQALEHLSWFNQIQERIILAKDVTSVLRYVELGECDWGIVYYSEALKSDKVKIAKEIPQELYNPIFFYIAKLNNKQTTIELYDFLLNKKAKEIFNKFGFKADLNND